MDLSNGHRQRLRQRFLKAGLGAFHDYEIIEMLLSLSTPRKDMKPIAKEIIRRFGSLVSVLEAPIEILKEVDGVGETNVVALKLPNAIGRRYLELKAEGSNYANSPSAVHEYLIHNMSHRNRENFMVLYLNGQNQILKLETMFEGSLGSSAVYPREVVKKVLLYDAAAVIFVHNHPSGNLKPSRQDIEITKKLKSALETIDVRTLDHLIIGGTDIFSFSEKGMI
jgi:DNA repair protein RadC